MTSLVLKKFTAVTGGEVWLNPDQVASVQPYRHFDTRRNTHEVRGTLIRIAGDEYAVHVSEAPEYVIAALQAGPGGVCRQCAQILRDPWSVLCDDCRRTQIVA